MLFRSNTFIRASACIPEEFVLPAAEEQGFRSYGMNGGCAVRITGETRCGGRASQKVALNLRSVKMDGADIDQVSWTGFAIYDESNEGCFTSIASGGRPTRSLSLDARFSYHRGAEREGQVDSVAHGAGAAVRDSEACGYAAALRLSAGMEWRSKKLGRDQGAELFSRRQAACG